MSKSKMNSSWFANDPPSWTNDFQKIISYLLLTGPKRFNCIFNAKTRQLLYCNTTFFILHSLSVFTDDFLGEEYNMVACT